MHDTTYKEHFWKHHKKTDFRLPLSSVFQLDTQETNWTDLFAGGNVEWGSRMKNGLLSKVEQLGNVVHVACRALCVVGGTILVGVVSESREYHYLQSRLNFRETIQDILQLLNMVTWESCENHMSLHYSQT